MKILGVIPARMASGRFPGKPMAKIHGVPMIGHCYFRSRMSKLLDDVYVATCDQEIYDYIKGVGGNVVMTKDTHEMCTDRVVEATEIVEKELGCRYDIVVNIQGDQPMVFPEMIDDVTQPLIADESIVCSSMMYPIKSFKEHDDPNRVKIVVDKDNFAMYMTREPIPSRKKWKESVPLPMYVHVALIPFRRDFLTLFGTFTMTPLESVESIDYLRAMENGYRIKMVLTDVETETIDTPEDLKKVQRMMEGDELVPRYVSVAVA
jgi:3-deoxy-manno-octulosonate cytidylyltransferase (CMP-KDO synthetase)